jgi:hypothetical protein
MKAQIFFHTLLLASLVLKQNMLRAVFRTLTYKSDSMTAPDKPTCPVSLERDAVTNRGRGPPCLCSGIREMEDKVY